MNLKSWRPTYPISLGGPIRTVFRIATEGTTAIETCDLGVVVTVHGARWLITQPGVGEIQDEQPAAVAAPAVQSSREKRR